MVRPCSTPEFVDFQDANATSTALAWAWCNYTTGASSEDDTCGILGSVLTVATEDEPAEVSIGTAFGIGTVAATDDSMFSLPCVRAVRE